MTPEQIAEFEAQRARREAMRFAPDIAPSDLPGPVRGRLRTLSKETADRVALHLLMAGRLIDTNPEIAYAHAAEAARRAGRIDVVREAAGLTAYHAEKYDIALRELRTARRLNGSSEHLAVMADCERGLGRPERAISLAASPEAQELNPASAAELAIVVSGARLDLGEAQAALAVLDAIVRTGLSDDVVARILEARAAVLLQLGRVEEAQEILAKLALEEEVVAWDLDEISEDEDVADDDDAAPKKSAAHSGDAVGPRGGEVRPVPDSANPDLESGTPGSKSDIPGLDDEQ